MATTPPSTPWPRWSCANSACAAGAAKVFGFYFLLVIAVLLLGYAAALVSFLRRGRKIPPAAYLALAGLNGLILAGVLAWAVSR
ncbi:hypothetical protein ACQP08_25655 [Micromonospora zamorensis]|uniref:hypothetical protein n=1 Tax=Micromonospora zamorensis TaxID=709883 RepID=UPI003D8E610C